MVLSQDQEKALKLLSNFVFNSNEKLFSLIGRPGVGKSTVIKEFIKILKDKGFDQKNVFGNSFILCAPTHKAANILSEGINEDVKTLHQFLTLSPKIDIFELDLRELKFLAKGDVESHDLVIIDESSMISDDLYDLLLEKCKDMKIIFLLDFKQLKPVKQKGLSKAALISNKFELTTNHRQSDPILMQLIEDSRNKIITDFSSYKSDNLTLFTSAKEMSNSALDNFKMQSNLEFSTFSKILTYTNDRVEKYNKYIHHYIAEGEEYCYNELLTGYTGLRNKIRNSEDFVVKSVKVDIKYLKEIDLTVTGFKLNIKSLITEDDLDIFILKRDTSEDIKLKLGFGIEDIRIKAINARGKARTDLWRKYYSLDESFCTPFDLLYDNRVVKSKTLDYGYAQTLHRAQGSTYDVVYYDNNSIQFCRDFEEKRQLQHVAMSRVSEQLNILI